jgi:sugar lactone lactonase YvrE
MTIFTRQNVCTILTLLLFEGALAQSNVGIGTISPDASAQLEINSSTQGLLIPTMTTAQRSIIPNPATGLLVFQTDATQGFCYYNGVAWVSLMNGHALDAAGFASTAQVYTYAGSGVAGTVNSTGTAAAFNGPGAMAADLYGNTYVADYTGNTIRKIAADGTVTTLAGSGTSGSADGTGTGASFSHPTGLTADIFGNVYVADNGNNKIRKITPAGVVTTLAGSGVPGFADGVGTAASFNLPNGITIDVAGTLYVTDGNNNKIRIITPAGSVSTVAGSGLAGAIDGTGAGASFSTPYGIVLDASGNLYVADAGNNKIRKVTPGGVVTTYAGSGSAGSADGNGTAALFNTPVGIAISRSGDFYVADFGNNKVRKITSGAVVTTLAGNGVAGSANGLAGAASFSGPLGLIVRLSGSIVKVYVTDYANNMIREIIVY